MNLNIQLFKNISRELLLLSKLKLNNSILINKLDRELFNIIIKYSTKKYSEINKNTYSKGGGFQKSSKPASHNNTNNTNSMISTSKSHQDSKNSDQTLTKHHNTHSTNNTNSKIVSLKSKFILVNTNKEILLYYSKIPFFYTFFFHLKYQSILLCLLSFVKHNPLYIIFPAAMPIAVFSIPLLLIKYLTKLKERKSVVNEVWLDRNGQELVIKYKESLFRVKKSSTENELLTINSIKNLPNQEAKGRFGVDPFPDDSSNASYLDNFQLFWKKYYNYSKYLILYKYPIYIDFSTLVEALNGSNIHIPDNIDVYLISANDNDNSGDDLLQNLAKFTKEIKNKII